MSTTYDNPLVESGEYARIFAGEIPVGAALIGMRDADTIVTDTSRYTTRDGVEKVRLTFDDGRTEHLRAETVRLVRNHRWRTITYQLRGEAVSHLQCEVCGRLNLQAQDRMALCGVLDG